MEIPCPIQQRGRALIDFEVGVRQAASRLQRHCETQLEAQGLTADNLEADMETRHRQIDAALAAEPAWRARALLGDWTAREHGRVCEEAFDAVREEMAPRLDALAKGPTTLQVPADFVAPRYWSEIWFHRTRGGWDASEYNGFIHGEMVHRRYVSRVFPGDLYAQRRAVLKVLPQNDYRDIVEFGTSSGHYTVALAEAFPQAHIIGIDPSIRMLEQAQRVGNAMGQSWDLRVGVGEDSGLAAESADLVTAYAIHHELPTRIINRWFDEAMRLLRPGGVMLFVDVPRYAALDRMAAWRFDWLAKWGGEPYWRTSASLDLGEGARAAGFIDVSTGALLPMDNPYYVVARKPNHG